MTNFNYKKFLAENKLTQTSKLRSGMLTEGQFSWMTQDTGQQIGSEEENTIPVYMFDDKGNFWYEKNYDGYGEFDGMDYYELLDKMNGGRGDRGRGIDLAFGNEKVASRVLFPALVTRPNFDWRSHDFTKEAKHDPNQSWYAGEREDDEFLQEAELSALELDQVKNIAQQVADEFTKYEDELDLKFSIHPDSVEASPKGAGFDLDVTAGPNTPGDEWKDEKGFGIEMYLGDFAGGSYMIKPEEGKYKIYNAATGNSYIGYATPEGEVVFEYEKSMNEEKTTENKKMKKSELKDKIKEMVLAEMNLDINDETPESEEDFLAEVEAILAEADEVAVDDTEVAVGGEENIDVDTTVEVDPNVKAVQDALTQAQAAAQKLGDSKLTDQIGNTITFFTRAHVVEKGAVAEADEMEEGKKEYYKDAEADDAEHIKALEKDMEDDKKSSMNESMFPMLKKILK
jgi:hypothetical protein